MLRLIPIWQALAVRNSFGTALWTHLLQFDNAPGLHRLVCQMIFNPRDIKPGCYREVATEATKKVLAFLASTTVYPISPTSLQKSLDNLLYEIFLQERDRCDKRISNAARFVSQSYGKGSQLYVAVENQVEIALNSVMYQTGKK